jgi:hypothetical protein
MPMPVLVTIPIATFDMAMEYTAPSMKLIMDRANVVDQLFRGFREWDIKVDDVEVITEGKPSTQGIKFKIPSKRTAFFFGAGLCRITRDDANWESAEDTIAILNVGLKTLVEVGGVTIGTYKTSIALHIQPKTAQFIELIKPFASPKIAALVNEEIDRFATVVKWKDRRITIDGSAQLANAAFLKFERDFDGSTPIGVIATKLRADEDELFAMLNIEEDLQ